MSTRSCTVAGAAGLWLLLSAATSVAGGVDGGYTMSTTSDPGGPAPEWIDISASGTLVTGLTDDNSAPAAVALPSGFRYFGSTFNSLKIGSNGWVSFSGTSNIAACFPTIPAAGGASDNYLAPYLADLNFTGAGNPGQVRTFHDVPANLFIVSYIGVPYWNVNSPGWSGSTSFQVVLDLTGGVIRYNYLALTAPIFNAACNDVTVGIESPDGTMGIAYTHDTAVPSPFSIVFLPPGSIDVTPTSGLVTGEGGATADFSVVLSTPPTADVVVPVSSSDITEGTVAVTSLTFTAANWNTPQTVTVTGANDFAVDGAVAYSIVLGAATSTDARYAGIDPTDVALTNDDDDIAGIAVTPPASPVTTEAGGTASFSLVLTAQPGADVTIPIASGDTGEGTVSAPSVTFTNADWNVPKSIVVTGADDALVDGDVPYAIVTGASTSSDPAFDNLVCVDVALTNTDDDSAGIAVVPPVSALTTEAGGTASFSLVLTAQPSADVTIPLASSDTTEGTLAVASATFTNGNWNVPQSIVVTGADDAAVDGTVAYSIVTGLAASADAAFDGLASDDVALGNTDDDSASLTIGEASIVEGSGTDPQMSFDVTLGSAVAGGFTVSYATADGSATAPADYTAAAGTLVFAGTAGEVQTLQVTVIGDTAPEPTENFVVNLGTPSNPAVTLADGQGNGTIADDDVADLSVTLSDAPDPVVAGGNLTYAATVSNAGPIDATTVSVTLTLPSGTSFVSGSVAGGGSCAGSPVVCTLTGSLATGASRTLTVVAAVSASTSAGATIDAAATVASAVPDPNAANDSASTSTLVSAGADLVLTLTGPAQIVVGEPVTFIASSQNLGPSAAQNVVVTITLDPGLGYAGHTPDAGANCTAPGSGQSGAVVCTWPGATAPGTTRTLQVLATGAGPGAAGVSASSTSSTSDPTPANNAGGIGVTIGVSAALAPVIVPLASGYGLLLLAFALGLCGIAAMPRRG